MSGACLLYTSDEMVQSEPGLEFILPEFLDFIDGEILIGHNIQLSLIHI